MNRFIIFAFTVLSIASVYSQTNTDTNEVEDSILSIFVSPKFYENKRRKIEIYWNFPNYQDGDRIELYSKKPGDGAQPFYSFKITRVHGLQKTNLKVDLIPSEELGFIKKCFDYYVTILRSGKIIKENCLKTEPTWMEDMKCALGNQSLMNLFIPGTHNSAAYDGSNALLKKLFYNRYVITQDEDILGQLIYGVRYLDIRVCYKRDITIKWWGCHLFITVPMQRVINDVKNFLDNTNEIVIFDVQDFSPGFKKDPKLHEEFIEFLLTEFKDYALPFMGWKIPLNEIWTKKKNLIIGYDDIHFYNESLLWPRVSQKWGDVRSVDNLYNYLRKIEEEAASSSLSELRSAMAEMTPNTMYIIKHPFGGIRVMSEESNPKVTGWYNTLWQHSANIVSLDYIRYSGIVDVALKWNSRRFNSTSCLVKYNYKISNVDPIFVLTHLLKD